VGAEPRLAICATRIGKSPKRNSTEGRKGGKVTSGDQVRVAEQERGGFDRAPTFGARRFRQVQGPGPAEGLRPKHHAHLFDTESRVAHPGGMKEISRW